MPSKKQDVIQPLESYGGLSAEVVISRGTAAYTGLKDNPNFTTPPVDLTVFKSNLDSLATLNTEAKDGSKKVIAQKNKQQAVVIKQLRMLGRYVEVTCNGEMAIFKSSGFQPKSTTKTPPQPLPVPVIRKVKHGPTTGQLVVQVKGDRKASSHELRFSAVINGAAPSSWVTQQFGSVKPPVVISNLTPGTVYAVQVRALGPLGFTNWSDSDTCMCI
jgi:hypothetical protein